MNCYNHLAKAAVAQCSNCHKGLCSDCASKYTIPTCDECFRQQQKSLIIAYVKPLVICIVLFIIGYNVEIFGPDRTFRAFMFMCVYGGWKAINTFAPQLFLFSIRAIFFYYLIKLGVSMLIGFFVTPVYLGYCIYRVGRAIRLRGHPSVK